jgi:hypothetical protein
MEKKTAKTLQVGKQYLWMVRSGEKEIALLPVYFVGETACPMVVMVRDEIGQLIRVSRSDLKDWPTSNGEV